MKARYLTFFSYIGSAFRSSEKIWLREGRNYPDPESIQGLMEISLLKLKSLNYPNVHLSSRTDGGVHALNCSAHFDLEKFGSGIYEPNNLSYHMNKFFHFNKNPIFIKRILRVNDDFHARFKAIRRTYVYRLAVVKKDVQLPKNLSIASLIPVEEWKRCQFIRLKNFDIERFKEGAKYMVGYHDWSTFKKFNKLRQTQQNRREIYCIDVRPSKPALMDYSLRQSDNVFDYWDIEIQGKAFVHNQIRRMVATLITVAIGKLEPKDIQVMLQVPSKHSWHNFIGTCPPDGLYLCNVEYDSNDLIYTPGRVEDSSIDKENIEELSDSE